MSGSRPPLTNDELQLLEVSHRMIAFIKASVHVAQQRLQDLTDRTQASASRHRSRVEQKRQDFQQWLRESAQYMREFVAHNAELAAELVERSRRDRVPTDRVKKLHEQLEQELEDVKMEVVLRRLDPAALNAAERRIPQYLIDIPETTETEADSAAVEADPTDRLLEEVRSAKDFEAELDQHDQQTHDQNHDDDSDDDRAVGAAQTR